MGKVGITCLKVLFMLFNFILLAFGLVLLTLGVWMKVQSTQYFDTLMNDNYDKLPWILIGVGIGVVIIGNLGLLSTLKGVAPLLYMYAIFLAIIFIGATTIGIYGFFNIGKVFKTFDEGLTKSMDAYFSDEDSQQSMDQLQVTLKCCGNNSSHDWFSVSWKDGKTTSEIVPMSCCKEETCDNTNTSVIYNEGCYIKVTSFCETYLGAIGAIGGVVIGVQFIDGVVAYQLAKHINKFKNDQMLFR